LLKKDNKNKKLASICDTNYTRAELLSLLSIKYSIEECKQIWADLSKRVEKSSEDENGFSKPALRLDFAMTYYQLNCLLIDNFHDPDYFARNSMIDMIIEHKPAPLNSATKSQL
jgi:hypothetical protein